MRDAIDIMGKPVMIDDVEYIIRELNFIPDTSSMYVTLESEELNMNYPISRLLPLLSEQYPNGKRNKRTNSN